MTVTGYLTLSHFYFVQTHPTTIKLEVSSKRESRHFSLIGVIKPFKTSTI